MKVYTPSNLLVLTCRFGGRSGSPAISAYDGAYRNLRFNLRLLSNPTASGGPFDREQLRSCACTGVSRPRDQNRGRLRPYRPSGFVVKAEKLGEKLVIHNYGHGGGGITLSWGTSQMATELLVGEPFSAVAVIGCGAVGLATARLLQDRGLRVTIYASELPPNTTSNIAGGQWSPFDVFESGKQNTAFMNQFLRATELAYRQYQTLVGARYGVRWIRNYSLRHHEFDEADLEGMQSPIHKFMPEMRELSDSEHPFSGYQHVRRYDTMLIEPPIYLNAMLTDFRIAGGAVRMVKFEHVTQLQQLAEPVIFNCTGLGARALFDDQELTPIKGQLTVLLPQAEVNYLTLMEDDLYMFPRTDGVLLGVCFKRESGRSV